VAKSDQLVTSIIKGIQEKKGENITLINLTKIPNAFTEHFIICTGNSDTHLNSISDSIAEETAKDLKEKPWSSEGKTNREWIILDYSNVVVHLFRKETRERYNLEGLWGDGEIINLEEGVQEIVKKKNGKK
jgi:ribosome-associated protein